MAGEEAFSLEVVAYIYGFISGGFVSSPRTTSRGRERTGAGDVDVVDVDSSGQSSRCSLGPGGSRLTRPLMLVDGFYFMLRYTQHDIGATVFHSSLDLLDFKDPLTKRISL